MKNFVRILLGLSIFLLFDYNAQTLNDYESDKLYVVWGEENYSGTSDCNAHVSVFSNGENINIKVDVLDDILVFNDDPLNSDHIELWFSLPHIPEIFLSEKKLFSSKFIYRDSSLYLVNEQPNLEEFKKNISDPIIHFNSLSEDSIFHYSQIDTSSFLWLKNEIDEYLDNDRNGKPHVNHFFFGLVHFGFLPNQNNAIQYDKEFYYPIESNLNIELPDLSSFITFEKQVTQKGYSYNITIPCEALGFANKSGIHKLRFLVDVVDVDKSNRQETLLSTNGRRIWGNPQSFNNISLSNSINVPLHKNLPMLGQKEERDSPYNNFIRQLPETFLYSMDGWTPVELSKFTFMTIDEEASDLWNGISKDYYIENISKISIRQYQISYERITMQDNKLEYLGFNNTPNYNPDLVVNGKLLLDPVDIIKIFLLPNGDVAYLSTEYVTHGKYSRQVESLLYLVTDSSKEIIAEFENIDTISLIIPFSDIDVMSRWGDGINKIDFDFGYGNVGWKYIVRHSNNNSHLYLELSDSLKYQIEWDDNGKITNAFELQK